MSKRTVSKPDVGPSTRARLSVRVTPRASRDELQHGPDGSLTLRLTAPPVEGAANAACCAYLADFFNIAKSRVFVVTGHKSRNKVIEIEGLTQEAVKAVLETPRP